MPGLMDYLLDQTKLGDIWRKYHPELGYVDNEYHPNRGNAFNIVRNVDGGGTIDNPTKANLDNLPEEQTIPFDKDRMAINSENNNILRMNNLPIDKSMQEPYYGSVPVDDNFNHYMNLIDFMMKNNKKNFGNPLYNMLMKK